MPHLLHLGKDISAFMSRHGLLLPTGSDAVRSTLCSPSLLSVANHDRHASQNLATIALGRCGFDRAAAWSTWAEGEGKAR